MRADEYQEWIAVGQALVELGDAGRGLWMEWSSTSPRFDASEASSKWETFTGDRSGHLAVFARAQALGWVNPASKAAQKPNAAPKGGGPKRVHFADLRTNKPPKRRFYIERLLPEKEVTLLAGDGGTGKSMVALYAAICTAMGLPFFGRPTLRCKTIFYSAEDDEQTLKERLLRLCEYLDLDPAVVAEHLWIVDASDFPELFIEERDKDGTYTASTEWFTRLVADAKTWGAQHIVIDNASDTYDANENIRRDVSKFMRLLKTFAKELGAAILLLAHLDKASVRDPRNRAAYSGSSAWHNKARSRLLMYREIESGAVHVTHEKWSHSAQAEPLMLAWSAEGILEPTTAEVVGLTQRLKDSMEIEALLGVLKALAAEGKHVPIATRGQRTTHKALAEHLSFPQRQESKRTNELVLLAAEAKRIRREDIKTNGHTVSCWVIA